MTDSDSTLIDSFKVQVERGFAEFTGEPIQPGDAAASCAMCVLDKLASDLQSLRAELTPAGWRKFCREMFQERISASIALGRFGSLLRTWEQTLPSIESKRKALAFFDSEIREVIRMAPRARILSLGENPLNNAEYEGAQRVVFDCDLSIGDTLARKRAAAPMQFDFIYSTDWLNQSTDACAIEWLDAAACLLRESGRLVGSNLMPDAADAAYLEARWNFWPVYRDEQALAHLASQLSDEGLRGHAVFRNDAGAMLFLEIQGA
jgi:hypothetical protein